MTGKYIIDKVTIAFQIHRIKHLAATKRPKISIPSRQMHSDASKELAPQTILKNSLIDYAYCYYTLQNALVLTPFPPTTASMRSTRRCSNPYGSDRLLETRRRKGETAQRSRGEKKREDRHREEIACSTGLQKPPCPRCVRTKSRICFR